MDEFRFTDNSPACSADACGVFERLEMMLAELRAMLAELRAINVALETPKVARLSADDIHSLSRRR